VSKLEFLIIFYVVINQINLEIKHRSVMLGDGEIVGTYWFLDPDNDCHQGG
jgi:hypothetical protein